MNITEIIKKIMNNKNIKITQLNDLLNEKHNTNYTVQNLSRRLNKDDLKFSDARDILEVLGYKIDIVEDDYKVPEIFKDKDYVPENQKQLSLIDEESSINPIILDEIESAIHNEVKRTIESFVKLKVDDYFKTIIKSSDDKE